MAPVVAKRYTLTGGENTFSSPAATNPEDARKLQSLIPSLAGYLERERPALPFTNDTPFASRVGFFHEFKRNTAGVVTYHHFSATATKLFELVSGAWLEVTSSGGIDGLLSGFPVAVNIDNQMHMSDGVSSYIFDGFFWIKDGLDIPRHAPVFQVVAVPGGVGITSISRTNGVVTVNYSGALTSALNTFVTIAGVTNVTFNGSFLVDVAVTGSSVSFNQPGQVDVSSSGGTIAPFSFSVTSNRYYWSTFSDQSVNHPHESSSSPISNGTGAFTGNVKVQQRAGTISITLHTTSVVGIGTDFSQDDVGKYIWMRAFKPSVSVQLAAYPIVSVQDAQHLTIAVGTGFVVGIPFVPTVDVTLAAQNYVISPSRATNINFYASSSEEDKVGNLLASVTISSLVGGSSFYLDQSAFIGTIGSYFQDVNRPLLNDPTQPTSVMEVHKNRIWRRLPTFPNFFSYSGNEEILAEQAGTPSECVPGDDPNTVSPAQVNETSLPDQGAFITGLKKHGDSLYIGSEINIVPLFGSSLADFQLSEAQAFAVGLAGRRCIVSTPFGLAFVSYDLKVYLYPSQYAFGVDSTTALVELGRPKRPEFELIDGADYPQVGLTFYNWGRRNWLVLNYRRVDQSFATWVFDFETKGWFQLQQGYTAVAVFEMTPGRKSLIAAATDNRVYVIDDLTGNFPVPDGTNYPVGYFRQMLDFSTPDQTFVIQDIGFETSDSDMTIDVTMWLDPIDPENPGIGIPIVMTLTKLGANSYLGRPNSDTGASCERALIEFAVAASPVNGRFHGYTTEADKIEAPTL